MKLSMTVLCLALCSTGLAAKTINSQSPFEDKVSYSFGYVIGHNNIEALKHLDLDSFIEGLKTATTNQPAALSDEEMAKTLTEFKQRNDAKQLIEQQKLALKNAQAGQKFLTENAKKSDIHVTKSGLQYQILASGKGKKPTSTSKVKVNYEGRLLDGTVFDSSIARQHPVEFQVNQVIEGWKEGLPLMKEGAKYRFFIPAKLAYGEIGAGDAIEPNSTLIFDVDLLEVK